MKHNGNHRPKRSHHKAGRDPYDDLPTLAEARARLKGFSPFIKFTPEQRKILEEIEERGIGIGRWPPPKS